MHRGRVVSFNPLDVGAFPTDPLQLDYPRYEKREFKEWLKGPEQDKAEEWDQWFDSLSKDVQDYWLALSGEDQINYSFKTKLLKKKAIEDPIDPFKLIESEYEFPEEFYDPVKFEDNGYDDDKWERLPQHEASGLIGLFGGLGPRGPRRRLPGTNIPRRTRRALSKVGDPPESFKNVLRVVDAQSMEVADSIEETKTVCAFCNGKAVFNLKLVNGKPISRGPLIDLGADEKYCPACPECFQRKLT